MAMPKGPERNPADSDDDRYDASGVGAEAVVRRASAELLDYLRTIHPDHKYRDVVFKRFVPLVAFAAMGYWAAFGIPQDLTNIV